MYWALITELGSFLGYNTEEMHLMMAYKYLSYKNELLGDEVVVVPSTTKLKYKSSLLSTTTRYVNLHTH